MLQPSKLTQVGTVPVLYTQCLATPASYFAGKDFGKPMSWYRAVSPYIHPIHILFVYHSKQQHILYKKMFSPMNNVSLD